MILQDGQSYENFEDLLDIGFSKKIADDIEMLTRVKPCEYSSYIDKIVNAINNLTEE